MPSRRMVSGYEEETISKLPKIPHQRSNLFLIPLIIFLLFGSYHSYQIYQSDQITAKEMQEKGKNCLYEFKVQQCNPMNMTDECNKLAECFQTADNTESSLEFAIELA